MFTVKAILEKITSRWFKPRKASEPYGSPKLAPLKYNPIDVEELKAIFQEFNSKTLNNYFEEDCFVGIKNHSCNDELQECLLERNSNFRYGIIPYFDAEFITVYVFDQYGYDEFWMPEDLIGGYQHHVSEEQFNTICQKLHEMDMVLDFKIHPVGRKEFIFLFTIIYCTAKLTDGLVIMDNVWFEDMKKNRTIYRVYNADMLEQQLKHWVEESDV